LLISTPAAHKRACSGSHARQIPKSGFTREPHGFMIVSKDNDFAELAILRGSPPKVVWLRIGNCSSGAVERLLRDHMSVISQFNEDPDRVVLELYD
jgi:predicted nuclease of predicted toxin-antitoxin system